METTATAAIARPSSKYSVDCVTDCAISEESRTHYNSKCDYDNEYCLLEKYAASWNSY